MCRTLLPISAEEAAMYLDAERVEGTQLVFEAFVVPMGSKPREFLPKVLPPLVSKLGLLRGVARLRRQAPPDLSVNP